MNLFDRPTFRNMKMIKLRRKNTVRDGELQEKKRHGTQPIGIVMSKESWKGLKSMENGYY